MKKIIFAASISVSLVVVGALLMSTKPTPPQSHDAVAESEQLDEPVANPLPTIVDDNEVKTKPLGPDENFLTINEGETLHSILRPHGISLTEIAILSQALKPYLRATDLAAKDLYRFHVVDDKELGKVIDHLVIRKIDQNRMPITYRASRRGESFTVAKKEPPVREVVEYLDVAVKGTLYQTFNQLPFGTELMQRLMNIFAWHMRLPKDVMAGDHIEVVVLKRYIYDEFIGFGKIETARYRQKARTLTAMYFHSKDNKIKGYFDEKGKSLEKEFAISPVYETTATSNQKWRVHPVRKIRMRHNGVDFRGIVGTEFYCIADGEIIEKRYDINVGNMIRVRHKYGVHSEYFHADSLVDSLAVGQRVRRGQLLGTIGRTGRLCTGPHLHMGLYTMRGEKKNFIELSSLRNTLKATADIGASHLAEFSARQHTLFAYLKNNNEQAIASSTTK